jgi:cation transport ATPase
MVSDDNDAPALACRRRDYIGTGTDVAMAAASYTDQRRPAGVESIDLSADVALSADLFWAFFYNVILIPLRPANHAAAGAWLSALSL